jgi:AraC family transcriptional regulator of adaptative response / DNA-3-methyladenine glycosylase II
MIGVMDRNAVSVELPYRAPFDWTGLVGFLGMRAIAGVEAVSPAAYARAIALGGEAGVVTVSPSPPGDRLIVTVRFPDASALPAITARLRRIFDLDADTDAIAAHLGADPDLGPRVAARPGLRVPGAWDGFELAVRAILGQQITVVAATRLAARLVRDFGEPLPASLAGVVAGVTHVFPSPRRLVAADLSVLPMPRARSAALSALAAATDADPGLFEPRGGLAANVARLRALPGIGEWTAQYIAMRQLREPDAFPAGDIGLMRALTGPDGQRPTAAALQARAEAWRPWRAYAALHLWTAGTPAHDRQAA